MIEKWDEEDALRRRAAEGVTRAAALQVADDPDELERIANGDLDSAREVLARSPELAEYLDAVEAFLLRYVAFPSEHEAAAIALWVALTRIAHEFETSPILAITSAEMRSGKTRVLEVLEPLVPRPLPMITPSEALVYTVLAQRPRPTLLLDEVDAVFSPRMGERYEGLRAILNSGNRQGTPVLRVKLEGRRREVDAFDVFGPKAIAGIGKLPDTVADRAIPIRLKRRAPGEQVARFRRREASQEASQIPVPEFSVTGVTLVTGLPDELNDRAQDSWEPLLTVAAAAGGTWPTRARLAAIALSGGDEYELSTGIRLLSDIRDAFADDDHLSTITLLDRLHGMEEAPWGDWYGKPLTPRALAKLLQPYRVRPQHRRVRAGEMRGYFRADLADAWERYLTPLEPVTTVTSVTDESEEELLEQVAAWRFGTAPEPEPEAPA